MCCVIQGNKVSRARATEKSYKDRLANGRTQIPPLDSDALLFLEQLFKDAQAARERVEESLKKKTEKKQSQRKKK
jgi:hypothetical protein